MQCTVILIGHAGGDTCGERLILKAFRSHWTIPIPCRLREFCRTHIGARGFQVQRNSSQKEATEGCQKGTATVMCVTIRTSDIRTAISSLCWTSQILKRSDFGTMRASQDAHRDLRMLVSGTGSNKRFLNGRRNCCERKRRAGWRLLQQRNGLGCGVRVKTLSII